MQDKVLRMPDWFLSLLAACSGPDQLVGPRVERRARTCWRDYNSQLAWERPVIPEQELEEVFGAWYGNEGEF